MRILLLSHYFFPEGNAPASRWHAFARQWVAAGHQVTVITGVPNVPDGVPYRGYENRWHQRETIDGIEVIRIWTYLAANAGFAKRILNFISFMVMAIYAGIFVRRPDRIIATSPQFFCGWAGVILAKLRRVRMILEIRDLWPESIAAVGAMGEQSLIYRALEILEKGMYRGSDEIVTVGEGYAMKLREKGVPDAKITIIPNGADPDVFSPQPRDRKLEAHYGLTGKTVIAYVGTVGMASALDVMLDVAAQAHTEHPELAFVIMGDGADRTRLESACAQRGLENVHFTGRIAKDDMPAYWSLADIALVHLRGVGLFQTVLPSKIFEAMAMAKPILNGVSGEAARIVETADAGRNFVPEDAASLWRELEPLLDPTTRTAYGEAGRRFVQTTFHRRRFGEIYLQLLRREGPQRRFQAAHVESSSHA